MDKTIPEAVANRMSPRVASNYVTVPEAGCWIWTGAWRRARQDFLPYGVLRAGPQTKYAHRAFYEELVGPIPHGLFVCHKCDTPQCVNPAHLYLGDGFQNMADMDRRGRGRFRGERSGHAILTESQVREIHADQRTARQIAAAYGVSPTTIGGIKNGRIWKHLNMGANRNE